MPIPAHSGEYQHQLLALACYIPCDVFFGNKMHSISDSEGYFADGDTSVLITPDAHVADE